MAGLDAWLDRFEWPVHPHRASQWRAAGVYDLAARGAEVLGRICHQAVWAATD